MSARPLLIGFVLLPDFTLTPFSAIVDMLRLAADDGDGSRPRRARWRIVGHAPVRSSAGPFIAPDEVYGDPTRFDAVVICGGLLSAETGSDAARDQFVALAAAAGVQLVAVCTASFLLARLGLLVGKTACVSWFHHAEFRAAFPDVAVTGSQLFMIDGQIVTCAGGTGAVDVGAWLVERYLGPSTARKALDIIVAGNARAPESPQPHGGGIQLSDRRLQRATLMIEQRLTNPPNIAELARAVDISRRRLERLFQAETGMAPGAFMGEMRLGQARWLMATTDRPLTTIAWDTGFADLAHFSRSYKRRFGKSPSVDRKVLNKADCLPSFRA
jgi:transcriptional regulator GlxA family with amidase domain